MDLQLQFRPFRFALTRPLRTAAGVLQGRRGWLLRLEAGNGAVGWGEVAPLNPAWLKRCEQELKSLPSLLERDQLEPRLPQLSGALGFGLGGALAELDGLVGSHSRQGWLSAPASAQLLPAGGLMLSQLDQLLEQRGRRRRLTLKWKVAAEADGLERRWLDQLMERLPSTAQLRLDANGGWNRATAQAWMKALVGDPRFAWLEQPLPPEDRQGLESLSEKGPVALDESLEWDPRLRDSWLSWQVRRPSQEGDPRSLLRQLQEGVPWRMVSTAFETGIGRRWLEHLAALQMNGPTPAAPGLAPGWCPPGPLFSADPQQVWAAAAI
jgi:O-succinylbenzoate synthase